MRTCPRCTLISGDDALACDCGFDFSRAGGQEIAIELGEARNKAFLLGALGSIAAATGGYMMFALKIGRASALVLVGILMLGRAIHTWLRLRDADKDPGLS